MATWGTPISLKGTKGDAGLSVLTGSGAPDASLGYDGQSYISAAGDLYFRNNGAWTKQLSLIGPMGLNGINGSFFAGTGAPDSSVYSGDGNAVYLRASGEVYLYSGNGNWTDTNENLSGPQGAVGPAGARGTQTYTGNGAPASDLSTFTPAAQPGDLYYDLGTAGGPYLYVLGS